MARVIDDSQWDQNEFRRASHLLKVIMNVSNTVIIHIFIIIKQKLCHNLTKFIEINCA